MFIFKRLKIGTIAVQVTRKVVEPSPPQETTAARREEPTIIFSGSPFTAVSTLSTMGSKRPTDTMIPKYRMAKRIMEKVEVTPLIPVNAKSKVSIPNPPIKPKMMGTAMMLTSGLNFFEQMTMRKTITVK